jgi:hypothetical protein
MNDQLTPDLALVASINEASTSTSTPRTHNHIHSEFDRKTVSRPFRRVSAGNLVSRNVHHIAFSKLPFCHGVLVRIPALTVAHCDVLRQYTKAIALEHVSDVLP